jgi:ABC-type multidrug transport system fused ATPase/permease subunit
LEEPLLSSVERNDDEDPEDEDAPATAPDPPMESESTTEDGVVTSRIRGTLRLLSLAKPQTMYLYIGCITLLVRLPFSFSIPHFVSTTLGALSQSEYEKARREIMWLFLLGTIDACLDFWCIFWFGYANQRIVRGVRIDTFKSIMKQEIGYFDKTTSGELASRLNSDCGEMAGDIRLTPLLIGLGVEELSVSTKILPRVGQVIRSLSYERCRATAEEALTQCNSQRILDLTLGVAMESYPDLLD